MDFSQFRLQSYAGTLVPGECVVGSWPRCKRCLEDPRFLHFLSYPFLYISTQPEGIPLLTVIKDGLNGIFIGRREVQRMLPRHFDLPTIANGCFG
jgi:hypothetical protein